MNDIAFTLRSTTENAVSGKEFIFFDTAPGGAGFCDQLLDDVHSWFAAALDVLNCSEGCGDSCYSCLRAYENQLMHTYLDRNLVIEGLQAFMAENWSETVRNTVSLPLKNLTQHRNVT